MPPTSPTQQKPGPAEFMEHKQEPHYLQSREKEGP